MGTKPARLVSEGHAGGMKPSDLMSPAAFTTGDQTGLTSHAYTSDDESILTGGWECAPCREEIDAYPENEMMTVLDGSVTVTDADGNAETYKSGDTFFIPRALRACGRLQRRCASSI